MFFFDLTCGGSVGIREPADTLKAIPIGTFALLLFGLPLLFLSSILAAVLDAAGCSSRRSYMLSAATYGLCFILALVFLNFEWKKESITGSLVPALMSLDAVEFLFAGLLSGAICGWIYWRIAVGSGSTGSHMTSQQGVRLR